jgi:hypothetical protein
MYHSFNALVAQLPEDLKRGTKVDGIPTIDLETFEKYVYSTGGRKATIVNFFKAFSNTGPAEDSSMDEKGSSSDNSTGLPLPDDITNDAVPHLLDTRDLARAAATNRAFSAITKKQIRKRCEFKTNAGALCTRVWTDTLSQHGSCVRYCTFTFNHWCLTMLQALALLVSNRVEEESVQTVIRSLRSADSILADTLNELREWTQDIQPAPYRLELFLLHNVDRFVYQTRDEGTVQIRPPWPNDTYDVSAIYNSTLDRWHMRNLSSSDHSTYAVSVSDVQLANFITTLYIGFGNDGPLKGTQPYNLAIRIASEPPQDPQQNVAQPFTMGFLKNVFTYFSAKDNDIFYFNDDDRARGGVYGRSILLSIPLLQPGQRYKMYLGLYRRIPAQDDTSDVS